ncbi:NAD(P)/FAD-dependent oxidoreductase [Actinomadura meridiana]|uniref:NAD(P)/FAD-dependent oxidoreductase n=1 Tax=Actinomadura meridiana TaxID=559626 RepID=A0ABP8CBD5_9ACTN
MTPDVAIVGGGPAGAAVAWHLATAGATVTLVHEHREKWRPVGQQLSGAARPILRAMGILDEVTAASTPIHEARSAWPGPQIDTRPSLLSPFGPPLAVNRPTLDNLLRKAAQSAGVHLVHDHVQSPPRAAVLIDATGTTRAISRTKLFWTQIDRLRCTLWKATPAGPTPQPWTLVEAAPDGWWYTAPTPDGALTVMRVSDLSKTNNKQNPPEHTAHRLGRPLPTTSDYRVATIGHATPPWSPHLIAVGDAAVAVDPLSSSGLLNALRLAEPAATAALGLLDGNTEPAHQYTQNVQALINNHLDKRDYYLTLTEENAPFWKKRRPSPQHPKINTAEAH